MNKNNAAIKVLTSQEEIELLRKAQKGKTKQEREKATRLLVYYNQSFVKYMVRGSHYPQNEISPDELTAEGIISLPQAIKEFDFSKAEKNRLASYAGYWIHQRIRSFIKKNQLLPQTVQKKETDYVLEENEEEETKVPNKKRTRGIVYYDKDYHGTEKDDKATSLIDTLADDDEQIDQQIQQRERKMRINELLFNLEYHEELIIRLFFGIIPTNWAQIYRLATEEKEKELRKIKGKIKGKNFSFFENPPHSLLEKYCQILAVSRKKEEVTEEFMKPEFWEHFREFPELALKNQASWRNIIKKTERPSQVSPNQFVSFAEWEKSNKTFPLLKKEVFRWINLGYQPEDISDPQNQILQKLGVSKKEKEQWKKVSSKSKNKNWLEQRLGKAIENWKKNILEKLKQINENR